MTAYVWCISGSSTVPVGDWANAANEPVTVATPVVLIRSSECDARRVAEADALWQKEIKGRASMRWEGGRVQ
jgi:hypothetical protein